MVRLQGVPAWWTLIGLEMMKAGHVVELDVCEKMGGERKVGGI